MRSIVYKYPGEVISISHDFNDELPTGAVADAGSLTAVNSAGETVGTAMTDTSMTFSTSEAAGVVTTLVTGGTDIQDYFLTLQLTTTTIVTTLQHKVEVRVRASIKQ